MNTVATVIYFHDIHELSLEILNNIYQQLPPSESYLVMSMPSIPLMFLQLAVGQEKYQELYAAMTKKLNQLADYFEISRERLSGSACSLTKCLGRPVRLMRVGKRPRFWLRKLLHIWSKPEKVCTQQRRQERLRRKFFARESATLSYEYG